MSMPRSVKTGVLMVIIMLWLGGAVLYSAYRVERGNGIRGDTPSPSLLYPGPRKIYGLLIGVADYPGTSNDLSYPDNDVADMVDMVVNTWYAPWYMTSGIDYEIKLYDSDANYENITRAFEYMVEHVGPEDLFIFYYSGHGDRYRTENITLDKPLETPHPYPTGYSVVYTLDFSDRHAAAISLYFDKISLNWNDELKIIDNRTGNVLDVLSFIGPASGYSDVYYTDKLTLVFTDNGDGFEDFGFNITGALIYTDPDFAYLCPYDMLDENSSMYMQPYLNATFIDSYLDEIKGKIFVILDACHSGGVAEKLAAPGRFVAAAAMINETSLESYKYSNGLFTYAFVDVFYDHPFDPNGDGYTSLGEAVYNLTRYVPQLSGALNSTHHPVFFNGLSDDFIPALYEDTDGDGYPDSEEFKMLTGPTDPAINPASLGYVVASAVISVILWIAFPLTFAVLIYRNRKQHKGIFGVAPGIAVGGGSPETIGQPTAEEPSGDFGAVTVEKIPVGDYTDEKVPIFRRIAGVIRWILGKKDVAFGELGFGPSSILFNRGKVYTVENIGDTRMPAVCIITGKPLSGDRLLSLPEVVCDVPVISDGGNDLYIKRYKIKIPVSEEAELAVIKSAVNYLSAVRSFIIYLLLGTLLYSITAFLTIPRFAAVIFAAYLFAVSLFIYLRLGPVVPLGRYIAFIPVGRNKLRIKIGVASFAERFAAINGLDTDKEAGSPVNGGKRENA